MRLVSEHRRVRAETVCVMVCLALVFWAHWLWSLAVCAVALWRLAEHWYAADQEEQVTNLTVSAKCD